LDERAAARPVHQQWGSTNGKVSSGAPEGEAWMGTQQLSLPQFRTLLVTSIAFAGALGCTAPAPQSRIRGGDIAAAHEQRPPKISLWQVTVKSNEPARVTEFKRCSGKRRPVVPEAQMWAAQHCQVSQSRGPDGSYITSSTCRIEELTVASRSVVTYSPTHSHSRIETRIERPQSSLEPTIVEIDSTYIGACPSGIHPGDRIMPDGKVITPARNEDKVERAAYTTMVESEDYERRFAQGAPAAAIAASPNPQHARLLGINIEMGNACAWVDTGGPDGVMPVWISTIGRRSGPVKYAGVIEPIAGRPLPDRVDGAFFRQLTLVECAGKMPAKPSGVFENPSVDGPLSALWATPAKDWAVIPAIGDPGYLGVMRRSWGGVIQTPVFPSPADVQAWIKATGDKLAAAVQAKGREFNKEDKACLKNLKPGDDGDRCGADWPSDHTVLGERPGG
jgi:hypothetical protein